jgi:hypothetical protein
VAGRSSVLVMILGMGVLFSMLYASFAIQSGNGKVAHDPHVIPTQPKISQLQAIDTIEKHIRSNVRGVEKISLYFGSYNFSRTGYNQNMSGGQLTNLGWNLEYVKLHPELLSLPLAFVHANGTVYGVNATNHSYIRACHITQFPPYEGCPMGEIAAYAARDRLVYHIKTNWSPSLPQDPFTEGHHIVDAETGEIVWNDIDYARENRPLPMPNVNFDNKTIKSSPITPCIFH